MKNYVGRKCKGFRFEDETDGVEWIKRKSNYIGKIGIIKYQCNDHVVIEFNDNIGYYPISLIEQHLIEEETPEIPQLGEGVLMKVSDDGESWRENYVVARQYDGLYLTRIGNTWKYARPIPQLPKYTHAELVEKIGHDFEIHK
jgi:hypothetical protein